MLVVLVGQLVLGCQSSFKAQQGNVSKGDSGLAQELSYKDEQKSLEELRQNIPKEVREENDALKEILDLTVELKYPPAFIQNKFTRLMQRRRAQKRRQTKKRREEFSRRATSDRDAFVEALDKEREEWKSKNKKVSRKKRSSFYGEIDQKRKDFFSKQKDERKVFEADIKQQDKDFFYLVGQQEKEFRAQMREYKRRWQEHQKEKQQKEKQQKNR